MEIKVRFKRDRLLYVLALWSDNYNTTTKLGGKEENLEIKYLNCLVVIIDRGGVVIIAILGLLE